MQTSFRKKQLPGRMEALALVLRQGIANSSQELKHLAGLYFHFGPLVRQIERETVSMDSGASRLSAKERAALPF